MGKRWGIVGLAAAMIGAYLLVGAAPQAAATVCQVSIINTSYQPSTLTVAPGTSVCWMNNETSRNHTVSSDASDTTDTFDSGFSVMPGQTFTHVFNVKGTFAYHCNIHPTMHGTIVVPPAQPVVTDTTPASGDNNTTPAVNGTAPNNDTVHVFEGSPCVTELGTAVANGTGNWSYTLTEGQSITSGDTVQFFAKTEENSTLSGCSTTSASYTAGTSGPDVTIDTGIATPGSTTVSPNPSWTFSSLTSNVSFACSVDEGSRAFSSCSSSYAGTSLPNGPWNFAVKVFSNADPTDERIVTLPFTVDSFTKIAGSKTTTKRRPKFTITTHVSQFTVECNFDNAGFVAGTGNVCQPATKLSFKKHTLVAHAIDQFGNVGPDTTKNFKVVRA